MVFNGQRPPRPFNAPLIYKCVPSRAGIRFDVKEMDAFRLKASEDVASESSFLLEIAGDSFTREERRALGLLLIPIESVTFDFLCPFIDGSIRVGMKLLDTMLYRNRVKGS